MYGYTPRPPIDVSFDSHTLDSTKDFLYDMLEARKLAEENLRMARDTNVFYANRDRKPRDFYVWQHVFLRVPKDSETLTIVTGFNSIYFVRPQPSDAIMHKETETQQWTKRWHSY